MSSISIYENVIEVQSHVLCCAINNYCIENNSMKEKDYMLNKYKFLLLFIIHSQKYR